MDFFIIKASAWERDTAKNYNASDEGKQKKNNYDPTLSSDSVVSNTSRAESNVMLIKCMQEKVRRTSELRHYDRAEELQQAQ